MSSSRTVYYKTHITAQTNFFSKSLSYIVQCLLHFQSLSVKSSVFIVACFVSMCNMNICNLEWREGAGFLFFVLGTVWLTLPTFYSPVALSMCRSSRGNVLVCSPGPSLLGLASGCSHYPLASPPPPPQKKTTHTHDSWPGCCCSLLIQRFPCAVPPHTGFHHPPSYVVEEQCNNVWMI